MELSILVAKIVAIAYFALGIGMVGGQISSAKVLDIFSKSQGLTLITGVFAVIIGMLLVNSHNIWVKDWPVLITLIGWGALIKGVLFLAFPSSLMSFKPMFKNEQGWGILLIALGALFGYFGFMA